MIKRKSKRLISIFLILCGYVVGATTGCLVGGVGANAANPGFFDIDVITVSQAHNSSNGAQFFTDTAVAMANPSASLTELTANLDGDFASIIPGMGIQCTFNDTGGGGTATDGPYFVTAVDTGANPDTLQIDLIWTGALVGDDVDIVIGGALPNTTTGLQQALDDDTKGDAASQNVIIFSFDGGSSVDITAQILVTSGGGTGSFVKYWIGSDSAYAALARGSYCSYSDADNNSAGGMLQIDNVDNIVLMNIEVKDPGGTGNAATSGEDGFDVADVTSGTDNIVLDNCRADNCYLSFTSSFRANALKIIDCVSINGDNRACDLGGGTTIEGGYFEGTADYVIINTSEGSVKDAIVTGGSTAAIYFNSPKNSHISNCTIYQNAATTQGILYNDADGMIYVWDCIIFVADATNDLAIGLTAGTVWEDNNYTNATSVNSGFITVSSSIAGIDWSANSIFVNAGTGDFRLSPTGTNFSDIQFGGRRRWMSSDADNTLNGKKAAGAGGGDYPDVTNTLAADTVQRSTGTASASGGGQPIVGGSIVR